MLTVKGHHESEYLYPGCLADDTARSAKMPAVAGREKRRQFEEIFIPLLDELYNMALRITRNSQDAEDLVQETYLKAYRFYHTFKENINPRAWIMTIMMNTFRTGYRKSKNEPDKVNYNAVEGFLSGDDNAQSAKSVYFSDIYDIKDITEYMRSLVSDDIIDALESVPLRYRIPVLLSDAEQFNYQEISDILNLNLGTVKSRIFRGRNLLKKSLYKFAVDRGICKRQYRKNDNGNTVRPNNSGI